MGTQQPTNGRLDGWKAISDYLGWHTRTVMRWESQKGLPVHRVPGGQRNAVYAYRSEIDEWLKLGDGSTAGRQPEENSATDYSSTSSLESPLTISDGLPTESALDFDFALDPSPWITRKGKKLALAGIAVALLAMGGFALRNSAVFRGIRITSISQVTDDGTMKDSLVTDGKMLFFSEHRNGRFEIETLPVSGGATRELRTPFVKAFPVDVSTDGKQLLILAGEGHEKERSLWRLNVANGELKQVGTMMCHAAAWSPDGNAIALASQNAIYLTVDEGKTISLLQTFEGVPESIEWLNDGARLRVELRDLNTTTFSFWDISFVSPRNYQIASLVPLKTHLTEFFNGSMGTDLDDRSFLIGGDIVNSGILVLAKHGFLRSNYALHGLEAPLAGATAIAVDRENKRIFAIGSAAVQRSPRKEHADIFWFDQKSGEFRPFLPGTGGEYVDFSRDGQWVTYFSNLDRGLHVSRLDGSDEHRIAVSSGTIQLPRWSPDGSSIAYMEQLPNRPWRIFVTSVKDGNPTQAGRGDDSQGAPTWSPDGRTLAYGGVECQEMNACAVHTIDIASGQESIVPGSDGLGTARWSPDGKFIAALDSIKHRVMLYSESTHLWMELASEVNGNDLSWSADSKSLFASRPTGDQPRIIRISVPGGDVTTALDLSQLSRLQGQFDSWFAIGPGDALIISREMSTNEIYSISYAE